MSIEHRLAKLEQLTRDRHTSARAPGISDEVMQDIRRVAAVCNGPDELTAYLYTLMPVADEGVASLEAKCRTDAVATGFARAMFDEVNG